MALDSSKVEALMSKCDTMCGRLDAMEAACDASDETMAKRLAANRKRERGHALDAGQISLKEYEKVLKKLADMNGTTVAEEHRMLLALATATARKAARHAKEFTAKEKPTK